MPAVMGLPADACYPVISSKEAQERIEDEL